MHYVCFFMFDKVCTAYFFLSWQTSLLCMEGVLHDNLWLRQKKKNYVGNLYKFYNRNNDLLSDRPCKTMAVLLY